MTRPDIYRLLKQRYVSGEFYENFLAHHESRKKLANFVSRKLDYFGFCVRKSTVSQSIPNNWKDLAMKGAARVRNKFKNEDVSVVISADETFLRFHESSSQLLAPKGAKRVVTAIKFNHLSRTSFSISLRTSWYMRAFFWSHLTLFARLRITKFSSFFATISSLEL